MRRKKIKKSKFSPIEKKNIIQKIKQKLAVRALMKKANKIKYELTDSKWSSGIEKSDIEEAEDQSNELKDDPTYSMWEKNAAGEYYPYYKPLSLTKKIPPGYYKLRYNQRQEMPYLVHKEILTDELLELPNPVFKQIINDVNVFWGRGDKFKQYGFLQKRGILLYGPPGAGKSALIQLIVKDLIQTHKGVLFSIDSRQELDHYSSFIGEIFREIEPDTPVMTIIEDIEGYTVDPDIESRLLQVLDGVNHHDKKITIATTNYLDRLKDRIKNRPSRFDRRYAIDLPAEEVRRYYLQNVILEEDLKQIDLDYWVKETEGLAIAHLKELIVSVIVLGNGFESTIEALKTMSANLDSTEYIERGKRAGFSFGG